MLPGSAAFPAGRLATWLAARQAFGKIRLEAVDGDPVLAHRVALPHRHRLVVQGIEVDRDAERRADLVLAAVAAADRAGVVEIGVPPLAELCGDITRLGRQVGVARQ